MKKRSLFSLTEMNQGQKQQKGFPNFDDTIYGQNNLTLLHSSKPKQKKSQASGTQN